MISAFRSRGATIAYAAAGVAALSWLLLRFPPEAYSFYPRCPIFTLLHIQCPGCGATRALAALLHGQLRQALHLNPLTTLLLPVALLYFLLSLFGKPVQSPKYAAYAFVALAGVFLVARNMP